MILYFVFIIKVFLSSSFNTIAYIDIDDSYTHICDFQNVAFQGGEILVYKAYYNWGLIWIPAGEAVFKVRESSSYYDIEVAGSSYPAYDSFFKLRDKFNSKIDKQTLLPLIFERNVHEDDYTKYERIEIDQKSGSAKSRIGKTKLTANVSYHSFENCIHDLLSVLYSLRNVNVENYKSGSVLKQNLLFDGEIFNLDIKYKGKSRITVRNQGEFDAIKVVPDLISGHVFKDGDAMEIWVTDDCNKMPLLVETPLKIGSLKAIIKSYQGLRNPIKSKIE